MGAETCELCGYKSKLAAITTYHVVPVEVTGKAGLPDSATAKLCVNCYNELQDWYSKKVSDVEYNSATKHFIPKSFPDMVKEYEAVYRLFAEYKRRLR